MSTSSNKPKSGAGHELAADLLTIVKLLKDADPKMTPDLAGSIASVANVALRTELGHIEYARARGEKPDIAFFNN
jgi:hypothetical protein